MMMEVFQMSGIVHCAKDRLKILVKYVMAFGPRCFKCTLLRPSGPMALDDLQAFMAAVV